MGYVWMRQSDFFQGSVLLNWTALPCHSIKYWPRGCSEGLLWMLSKLLNPLIYNSLTELRVSWIWCWPGDRILNGADSWTLKAARLATWWDYKIVVGFQDWASQKRIGGDMKKEKDGKKKQRGEEVGQGEGEKSFSVLHHEILEEHAQLQSLSIPYHNILWLFFWWITDRFLNAF